MSAMTYPAGDQIPITRTFVQDGTTTEIPLVGQVLNNGKTNWVGYDDGSAYYILASSTGDVEATSLADGSTYFISEGTAPAGYLATDGTGGMTMSTGSDVLTSSASMPSETGGPSSTEGDMSSSMTESAPTSSTSGAAGRVSSSGAMSMLLGLLAWFI